VLQHFGMAWHYQSPKGTLIAQNDRDIWTFQARFPQDIAPETIDGGAMLRDFAGHDFDYEILLTSAWTPHQTGDKLESSSREGEVLVFRIRKS
jgi:hypothetical protein